MGQLGELFLLTCVLSPRLEVRVIGVVEVVNECVRATNNLFQSGCINAVALQLDLLLPLLEF